MELSFDSKTLRTLCEDSDKAEIKFGLDVARALRTRLADMRAVACVKDLPGLGKPSETKGNPHPHYKIDLPEGYQITFCSNHLDTPMNGEKINWSKVSRIKILKIDSNE